MGAIVLDASKVNSYVLPNLVKSKNTMQDAYSAGQSLRNSLPSSFRYRSTVSDIVNQLYNIKREISDINTMISKKVERAKTIENRNDNRAVSIAKAASSIGSIVGTIGGAAIGSATGGVVGAVAGAVVGNKVGSGVCKGLVNTGAKVVNKFTSFCKNIWDGAKELGKKIYNACKKIANKVAAFIKDKILPPLKNMWDAICRGDIKYIGTRLEKTAASIWNTAVSFVKGIFSFAEALVDAVVIVVGGLVGSVGGLVVDLCQGLSKGEWDLSATKAVWNKGVMPIASADVSGFVFDWMYSERAYEPFKKGGVICEIAEGVGYYTGMIIATTLTAGAASAAGFTGIGVISVNTISQGAVAAVGSFGKNAQNNYNTSIDNSVKEYYIQETMKSNPNMTVEEATAIVENNLVSESYSNYDYVRKNIMNNVSGGEIVSSLAKAGGTALIDGGIYFAAGAASDAISTYKTAITSGGEVVKSMSPTTIKAVNMLGKDAKMLNNVTTGIKASKAYISEGYDCIVNGEKYDFVGATLDAASTVIAEKALFKFQGTKAGSKVFGSQKKPEVKKDSDGYKYLMEKNSVKNIEDINAVLEDTTEVTNEVTKTFAEKFKENFDIKKEGIESLKKGVQKGKEKALKDTTSGIYDGTLAFIGG